MRDTQQNITTYKKQIKHLKEKISTAFFLFLISSVMMVTSTFAWLVLSTTPELKGISTTVAGNGNLEIALASSSDSGTLLEPETSKVGDSNLPLKEKNITWGNLINIGDASYGLNKIVLRPATLNTRSTLESPLRAVKYGTDGRIEIEQYEFSYSNFNPDANGGEGSFVIEDTSDYGVRAISSVTYTDLNAASDRAKIAKIKNTLGEAISEYELLVSKDNPKGYIPKISEMIGKYLTNKFDSSANVDFKEYMSPLKDMMTDFVKCIDKVGLVYVDIANVQVEKIDDSKKDYYTWENLLENPSPVYEGTNLLYLDGINEIKKMRDTSIEYIAEINEYLTNTPNQSVAWTDIKDLVNFMVVIEECIINEGTKYEYKVNQIGKQIALDLLNSGIKVHTGTITKGALKDFETYIGKTMYAEEVKIAAKYIITITLKANVYTNAPQEGSLDVQIANLANNISTGNAASRVAGNVYGMSIDFFLRTNAENTYVTLEGKPVIELEIQRTTDNYICYKDSSGNEYYHIPDDTHPAPAEPNPNQGIQSRDYLNYGTIYSKSNGQAVSFVDSSTGNEVADLKTAFINDLSYVTNSIVIGYDGENRVWQEGVDNPDASTTQGNGSCYIFYPSDRLELEQMLELLDALSVAFIDVDGKVLAQCALNTEKAFEEPGKVTVPLEIISGGNKVADSNGDTITAITKLNRNEAKYISAIVYIDGEKVNNEDVNATTNISGYLNLQFGSSESLVNMDDEDLRFEEIHVNGSADPTTFEYVKGQDAVSNITLNITGMTPDTVTGKFVRQISSSQGVLSDDEVNFLSNGDGTWTAQARFNRPGTYVLRSVFVNGAEFDLQTPITITVNGFKITGIGWSEKTANAYVMSAERLHTTNLTVSYNGAYEPKTIVGKFRNSEDNSYVNVNFMKTDSGTWNGNAIFEASGTYGLDTLVVDGEVQDITEFKKTITLFLGISLDVDLSQTSYLYEGSPIDVGVYVTIRDNTGSIMRNLNNTDIRYNATSSNIPSLDAPLTWDIARQQYVGEFHVENPSIYSFGYLKIDNSTLIESKSDKLTVIPPEPPVYVSNETIAYQFAPNDDAFMELEISNSDSATIAAVMTNSDTGKTEIVNGKGKNSVWTFVVPNTDKTYSQNGTWTIEQLYLTDVFVDGVLYTKAESEAWTETGDENPNHITWDMSNLEEQPITTHILNDIKVSVTSGDKYSKLVKDSEGKDGVVSKFEGGFTESLGNNYYIPNYQITYTDLFNKSLDTTEWKKQIQISNTEFTYTHLRDTLPSWWTNKDSIYGTSNKVYKPDANGTIIYPYAGTYNPKLTLSIKDVIMDQTYSYNISLSDTEDVVVQQETGPEYNPLSKANVDFADRVTVTWLRPDVVFESVSPSTEHYVTNQPELVDGQLKGLATGRKTNLIVDPHHIEVWFNVDAHEEAHVHSESCITCGLEIHEHSSSCCDKSSLLHWHTCNTNKCGNKPEHKAHTYTSTGCCSGCTEGTSMIIDKIEPSKATAKLENVTLFDSAKCTVKNYHDWENGESWWVQQYTTQDVVFDFSKTSYTSTQDIGVCVTNSGDDYYTGLGFVGGGKMGDYDETRASTNSIEIVYNSKTYNISLETPLIINEDSYHDIPASGRTDDHQGTY